MVFELAFGHIPATPVEAEQVEAEQVLVPSRVDTPAEEDVDFGVHLTAHDDNNDNIENEDEIFNKEEGHVGFGSPDIDDVQELIEMCLEDPGVDVEHEVHDEEKQLKKEYVGKYSKISYCYSLVIFFALHIQISETFHAQKLDKDMGNIQKHAERKRTGYTCEKKKICKLLRRVDENCPPIDFDSHNPSNF